MARLNAKWDDFSLRGKAWDRFWHDAAPVVAGGSTIQWWDGDSWETGTVMRWTGSAWEPATVQRWTGGAWVPI